MGLNIDQAFGVHAQALKLRTERAQMLASNIANADTPHYKAVDIDFKTALANANAGGATMKTTHARHIPLDQGGPSDSARVYRVSTQPSLDGNTVDIQAEQAAFSRNTVEHQASLTFLSNRIKGLLTAIKGD